MEFIKLKNKTITFENLKYPIRMNFLLNIIEYLNGIDEISSLNVEEENEKLTHDLIHKQIELLVNLQYNSIEIDRIIKVFISHLEVYKAILQKWNIFAKFNLIKLSLDKIKKRILIFNEFSMEISSDKLDKDYFFFLESRVHHLKNNDSNFIN